jgi:hypothetical protein
MKVSYEEDLANRFGLQRRGVLGNRSGLNVRPKGDADQPLSTELTTSVCRSNSDWEKATWRLRFWQDSGGYRGVREGEQ